MDIEEGYSWMLYIFWIKNLIFICYHPPKIWQRFCEIRWKLKREIDGYDCGNMGQIEEPSEDEIMG